MVKRPECQCVSCEVDREKGRPQYVVHWPDGRFYNPDAPRYSTTKTKAMAFGQRHPFGTHFTRVEI